MIILEELKQQIIDGFDIEFSSIPIGQLSEFTELIELRIKEKVKEVAINYLSENIREIKLINDGNKFILNGITYQIIIGERDILEPEKICIAILELNPKFIGTNRVKLNFKIDGIGKYTKGELIVSTISNIFIDQLSSLIIAVYKTSYNWLFEFFRKKLLELETELSIELYSYLRNILSSIENRSANEYILFLVKNEDKAFTIVDRISGEKSILKIKENHFKGLFSPAQLYSHFLTTIIPFGVSNMKLAISLGNCVDVDIRKSKYFGDYPYFLVAMEKFWKSQFVSFFPIFRDGEKFLVAAFPSQMKEEILPILISHTPKLADIFNRHKNRARSVYRQLVNKTRDFRLARISGEFVGGVLKALLY